jgi:hypothetical protein
MPVYPIFSDIILKIIEFSFCIKDDNIPQKPSAEKKKKNFGWKNKFFLFFLGMEIGFFYQMILTLIFFHLKNFFFFFIFQFTCSMISKILLKKKKNKIK